MFIGVGRGFFVIGLLLRVVGFCVFRGCLCSIVG